MTKFEGSQTRAPAGATTGSDGGRSTGKKRGNVGPRQWPRTGSGHLAGGHVAVVRAPVALSAESWCNLEDEDPDSKWYWRVDEYPHPLTQPRYCNRYRPSFVCDPDRVMSKKQGKW
ncbi:hypothetical protein HPB52_019052 [Rhipicephalus sanguineus]|uniref:Uncharacterized protein n=1 Tax=Rhipicephalus sanguineus TaxID=34632 RepID=A0A9D4PKH1_RHISA|nr:hypothetical protein HPB52_019052 [Rhipicephalus sanguineus]